MVKKFTKLNFVFFFWERKKQQLLPPRVVIGRSKQRPRDWRIDAQFENHCF